MKLSDKQWDALMFLVGDGWTTSWWGGKPHTGWPNEMKAGTYEALRKKGLVTSRKVSGFDVTVSLTAAGHKALATIIHA